MLCLVYVDTNLAETSASQVKLSSENAVSAGFIAMASSVFGEPEL